MSRETRHIWRDERDEERAEVGGFIATQGCGDVWVWSSAGAHV